RLLWFAAEGRIRGDGMRSGPSSSSPSARRRGWLVAAGVAVATVAFAPVVIARVGPEAAGASPIGSSSTTTTTAPVDTTTTAAPAATSTTTTTAAPAATSTTTTTAPAAVRTADSVVTNPVARIEAIADSSGFDWRAAGVTIHFGYNPDACCHWGIYDYRDNSLWIGPTAFASQTRLRYVVLHELGHAWQWASGQRGQLAADMAPWGVSGHEALEYR